MRLFRNPTEKYVDIQMCDQMLVDLNIREQLLIVIFQKALLKCSQCCFLGQVLVFPKFALPVGFLGLLYLLVEQL